MEEDIGAIIATARRLRDTEWRKPPLNPLSSLPASKRALKASIKECIRELCAAYVSLATFIGDDEWEYLIDADGPPSDKQRRIMRRVLNDMATYHQEITTFRPLE